MTKPAEQRKAKISVWGKWAERTELYHITNQGEHAQTWVTRVGMTGREKGEREKGQKKFIE